jgi:methylthioxylose transferase
MRLDLRLILLLLVQGLLVALLTILVAARLIPLGVPGEWEWLRVRVYPFWDTLLLAGAGVTAYAGFVALGLRGLAARRSRVIESAWLSGLLLAAVGIQFVVPTGAASGYDLSKWAAVNYLPGSAGYFQIARTQAARDPWQFLADYPRWIRNQDVFHIGTHPPGLIVAQCLLRGLFERSPALTGFLLGHMPAPVEAGFREFGNQVGDPLSRTDRAALFATALLTLLACAGTVVPLYLLARAGLPAPIAWAAAALWPLAPAANLFQPVADTAYPLISTSALALAAWSVRFDEGAGGRALIGLVLAAAAGAMMALGMAFTLAFLPVGVIVAILICFQGSLRWTRRGLLILATGAGFLVVVLGGWAATGANPFVIALWNLRHHADFYVDYPRTYRLWLLVNPVELLVAIGLPSAVLLFLGFSAQRSSIPTPIWATLLALVVLNATGRNMGEVARLWMLFMPPLLVAAGLGFRTVDLKPAALFGSVVLLGLETLALQSMIQVVYPV